MVLWEYYYYYLQTSGFDLAFLVASAFCLMITFLASSFFESKRPKKKEALKPIVVKNIHQNQKILPSLKARLMDGGNKMRSKEAEHPPICLFSSAQPPSRFLSNICDPLLRQRQILLLRPVCQGYLEGECRGGAILVGLRRTAEKRSVLLEQM